MLGDGDIKTQVPVLQEPPDKWQRASGALPSTETEVNNGGPGAHGRQTCPRGAEDEFQGKRQLS